MAESADVSDSAQQGGTGRGADQRGYGSLFDPKRLDEPRGRGAGIRHRKVIRRINGSAVPNIK